MNNKKTSCSNASLSKDEFNSVTAVEQVYPAEIIDHAEHINDLSINSHDAPLDTQQVAANDALAYANIYSLNSARMTQHNRSLERRSSKSKLTDRRSEARQTADGHVQKDRRADNRAANVESIRLSHLGNFAKPGDVS